MKQSDLSNGQQTESTGQQRLLFVSGDAKTGTSSMVGILNAHPKIFILYEVNPARRSGPTRLGQQFLDAYPESKSYFAAEGKWTDCYEGIRQFLAERGHQFDYFGDKVLSHWMDEGHLGDLESHALIYLVRDLRTWLCKNVIVDRTASSGGVVPTAIRYVDNFLRASLHPKVLRVSMEQLVHQNDALLARLDEFLGMPVSTHANRWWASVANHPEGHPKNAVRWWNGHDSSQTRPRKEDTKVELRPHPFWDDILPIFDRHYRQLTGEVDRDLVARDREALRAIPEYEGVTLNELYLSVNSVSFGAGIFGTLGHRSSNQHTKPFRLKNSGEPSGPR